MLKRSLVIGLVAMLAIAGFTSCKTGLSAPVGSKDDYTEIPVNSADYEISKGKGYYLERPLPTSMYYVYSGGTPETRYRFTAKENVKIYYKEKVSFDTSSEVTKIVQETETSTAHIDIKRALDLSSTDSLDTEFNLKAGEMVVIDISVRKYNTDPSTAAEFYIWAE